MHIANPPLTRALTHIAFICTKDLTAFREATITIETFASALGRVYEMSIRDEYTRYSRRTSRALLRESTWRWRVTP